MLGELQVARERVPVPNLVVHGGLRFTGRRTVRTCRGVDVVQLQGDFFDDLRLTLW